VIRSNKADCCIHQTRDEIVRPKSCHVTSCFVLGSPVKQRRGMKSKYISVHTWTWTWKSIKIPSLSVHSTPLKSCESFASTRRRAAPHGPPWPWSRPRRHGTTRLLLCPVQGHGVMGSWMWVGFALARSPRGKVSPVDLYPGQVACPVFATIANKRPSSFDVQCQLFLSLHQCMIEKKLN
jgi:hypothetical protein